VAKLWYNTSLMITADEKAKAFALTADSQKRSRQSTAQAFSFNDPYLKEITEHLKITRVIYGSSRLIQMVADGQKTFKYLEAKFSTAYKKNRRNP